MKTLVLGIGNPILGDDGIGFHVAQELAKLIKDDAVDVKDASTSGLILLDIIRGYEKVIIVDAIKTEEGEPGEIYRLRPKDFFRTTVHLTTSIHDVNLPTVIELGNKLVPEEMPHEIVIFAIEVKEIETFTVEMTPQVKEAIPNVTNLVLDELGDLMGKKWKE
jgi:hydrogenase maturation protease